MKRLFAYLRTPPLPPKNPISLPGDLSGSRRLDGIHVIRDQARGVARAVVDGVAVVGSPPAAERVAPLPEEIPAHAACRQGQGGVLPRLLDGAMV